MFDRHSYRHFIDVVYSFEEKFPSLHYSRNAGINYTFSIV